ncbi:hypothetical protein [Gynurincola endophyticus]|uniref:hypothetical protein n=1 Tax=Gynurincola endophyticus TaxID=2479004 RepID=UPI000F8D9FD0|nr:hypothetical protein [Gynurincola endophyticus]
MIKYLSLFVLAGCLSLPVTAQTSRTEEVLVGKTLVRIETKKFGNNPVYAVNLHGNESTSVEAAEKVFAETGGTIIKIVNPEKRNLGFLFKGDSIFVDPNRIYTRKGIRATLQSLNTKFKAGTVREVKDLGKYIISKIPVTGAAVIALHNNTDGNLSILSYMEGGTYARDAAENYQGTNDPDDFFVTTSKAIFDQLKALEHNVTLQDNKKVKNDGSMSVYYGKKGIAYVNVEAEHGHLNEQVKMIRDLLQILSR